MGEMQTPPSETDYLIVGAGCTGLAFADSLLAESDAEVTIIDRQPGVGGHWLHAYPFVRLHSPSAYYGVNSLALGEDRIDESGENAGLYERASGQEIRDYFARVAERLTQTGRVRLLTEHDHLGPGTDGEQVRDLRSGAAGAIGVRRKVVDARYQESSIPATHTPSFDVAEGVRFAAINDLPALAEEGLAYTILGSGKTAIDACLWLLDNDVALERIRWVRPREAWFYNRLHFQPQDLVGHFIEGVALDAEAGAQASDLGDVFDRLEASGRFMRLDPSRPATMYRGVMLSAPELEALRTIEDVVRLGRVARIEADRIVLEQGEVATGPDVLHVDCTAIGVNLAPATPIFQPGRVVLQQVRYNSPPFNAALLGFIEGHWDDDEEKNRLSPPNAYAASFADWPRMISQTFKAEGIWLNEPDIGAWTAGSRLHLGRALAQHVGEPAVQDSLQRYIANVGAAVENLDRIVAETATPAAGRTASA